MPNTHRNICTVVVAFSVAQFTVSCSGGSDATQPGTGDVVGDGKAFVPDGVEYSLVEDGRALTLLAATVIDNRDDDSYWLVAFRNDERGPICSPQVNAAFTSTNSTDGLSEGQSVVYLQSPMYHSELGEHPCLKPGDVGMGLGRISWDGPATKTVKIYYQPRGYLTPTVEEVPSLTIGGVKVASGSAGNVVTGTLTNTKANSVSGPIEVTVFPLDSGGRPIDFGYALSNEGLAAGRSWAFTTTIPSPINKYVAYAVYGQLD